MYESFLYEDVSQLLTYRIYTDSKYSMHIRLHNISCMRRLKCSEGYYGRNVPISKKVMIVSSMHCS